MPRILGAVAMALLATAASAVGLFAPRAAAQESEPADPRRAFYDAAPLVESLRPNERAGIAGQAQIASVDVLPLYDMTIDLADDLRSFELDQTVYFTNPTTRDLGEVVLRLYANAHVSAGARPPVELRGGECLDGVTCRIERPSASAIVVRPARPIPPAGRLRIRLRLEGRLTVIDPARTTMMGQGMESLSALGAGHQGGDYGLLAESDGVASLGAFHPVLARMRAGRWEQGDASTMGDLGSDALFHVRARVRTGDAVRVVATGVEDAPRVLGDRVEHSVRASFVRDFALVASARLLHRDRRVDGVMVRSWHIDGHAEAAGWVLDAARHALSTFERRFGAYPFTELDVVEAPLVGGAGGVEYSGMVTVATMFYRPLGAGGGGMGLEARRRSMIEFVTAHEVAHQWWHGLVGSDSRQHPFQDECLAQYSAMLYTAERHGAARAQRETEQQVTGGYHTMRLMGRPDGAVDQPVSAFDDSLSYAGLVYGKGAHLYAALRQLLGDRRFFSALRDYVSAHRFRIAPARDLFDRMARGPHEARVRFLERRWLEEAHGDDDLGQPDLAGMLGGGGASGTELQDLLRTLGQSGALPGAGGDAPDPQQLLRGLMEMLGGGGASGGAAPGGAAPGDAASQDALRQLMEGLSPQ